jgi:hypothetical protein
LYWVIFSIGVALALFGLIRVFRYLTWMRIAWLSDGAREAIEFAIQEFEAGPVVIENGKKCKLDVRAERLKKGIERRIKRFESVSRWLWPQQTKSIASWASLPLENAMTCIVKGVKKASRKIPSLSEFKQDMTRLMADYEDLGRHFRDAATGEVVWATASFALGALTVSLYTLWLQIG